MAVELVLLPGAGGITAAELAELAAEVAPAFSAGELESFASMALSTIADDGVPAVPRDDELACHGAALLTLRIRSDSPNTVRDDVVGDPAVAEPAPAAHGDLAARYWDHLRDFEAMPGFA